MSTQDPKTDEAMVRADIVAAIKKYSTSGWQDALPVMFKGKDGWRCIGSVDKAKQPKDLKAIQPQVEGLLILNGLSAEKISLAEIKEGRFIACHA